MIAQTLVCWAQALLLDDPELRVAEPKTLRYRLWHTAGRIVRHARRASMAAELPLPGGSVRFGSSGPTKPGSVPTA